MTTATAKQLFGLTLVLLALTAGLFAQEDDGVHPFPKKLGVGFVLTTNTIVEAQTFQNDANTYSFSYEGVFAYGGAIDYALSDRFLVEGAYVYTKNKKVLRDPVNNPNGQQYTNVHQVAELGVKYLWNPYSRVVFYLTLGGCLFSNDYDGGAGVKDDSISKGLTTPVYGYSSTVPGIITGLGIFANIKTPIGLIAPGAEWRIDFFLKTEDRLTPYKGSSNRVMANISTYFSLPRVTVLWYPNL